MSGGAEKNSIGHLSFLDSILGLRINQLATHLHVSGIFKNTT